MKGFFTIIMILFCFNVHAAIYKCSSHGKISYQQRPCELSGSVELDINKQKDITFQQQLDAKAKMDSELADYNKEKQLKKQAYDKERVIRAEEDKAHAAYLNAQQAKRQADALEARNAIEARKRSSGYYYSGRYPYLWSPSLYPRNHKRPRTTDHLYTIELSKNKTNFHNKTGALKKWQ